MIHPAMNMNLLRTPQLLPHQKIHRWVAPTIHPPHLTSRWILSLNLKIARSSLDLFFVQVVYKTLYICL